MRFVSCLALAAGLPYPNDGASGSTQVQAVKVIARLFEPTTYDRAVPAAVSTHTSGFLDELMAHYGEIGVGRVAADPVYVVELNDACLSQAVIYVDAGTSPNIVYETFRPNDQGYTNLMPEEDISAVPSAAQDGVEYLYVGSVGSSNYGHWLVDDLPRMAAFRCLRARYPASHIRMLVPSEPASMNVVRLQSALLFLGSDTNCSVEGVGRHQALRFGRLHYCTPVSKHPIVKSPLELGNLVGQVSTGMPGRGDAIFVERRSGYGRQMHNLDVLRFRLEMMGFRSVDPETMTFQQQVDTFRNADKVIGCMGAAMTNTVFCPPYSRILHLAPEGWLEPFYWDLASIRLHSYGAVYGKADQTDAPPHRRSFAVDWEVATSSWKRLVALQAA